ncbi:MAG: ferrochelatase [Deltaproteobacteria bacterium]|jgi:ferrochelatase|nr:ferrochelatase [Deltaproteobacteria bacterium]
MAQKYNPLEKIAVVLLNLGGPEGLEDVEPFLYNLFSDRMIIRLGPAFMQKIIARLISWRRAPKSSKAYAKIGGGSPLGRITAEQAEALEKELASSESFKVYVAMRYWHPTAQETLTQLQKEGIKRVIALPLYPHYSRATTGSSTADLAQASRSFLPAFEISTIESWPVQPEYISALATTIKRGAEQFGGIKPQVVYSAHSLPVKFIEEGDPYVEHLKQTIHAVESITAMEGILCFQSRSGPVEWLSPSPPDVLEKLAKNGCKNVLMVPISFVSDHVETLYEIDMLYHDMARDLEIRLVRTESLNCMPEFIEALKELVLKKTKELRW